jgi:DNA-binding GntR family transcriptional regulator
MASAIQRMAAAKPEDHTKLQICCDEMSTAIAARDWAAFFARLIEFAKLILPIILPLFLDPAPPIPPLPVG